MKITYNTVKPMNVRSRLLSKTIKKQITNINMKTLKWQAVRKPQAYRVATYD